MNTSASPPWLIKLPEMALKLDNALYGDATCETEYSDDTTLKSRIRKLAQDVTSKKRNLLPIDLPKRYHVRKSALSRSNEAILKYIGIMSHALTCDAKGKCNSNENCQGMKSLLAHETTCLEENCQTCETLNVIRTLATSFT
jgi:hypothetical protein